MQTHLKQKFDLTADFQIVRMNLLNEVHFLKKVEKTPSFIITDGDSFFDIDMQFNQALGTEQDKEAGWNEDDKL